MKETISLPPELPGGISLPDVNARLRTGDVQLNWSGVTHAPAGALRALLAGMDLVEHADVLGLDTVPDTLSEDVLMVLSEQRVPSSDTRPEQNQSSTESQVEIWQPSEDESNETQTDWTPPEESHREEPSAVKEEILSTLDERDIREELEKRMTLDLLGPAGGPEEEITEARVSDRYLVGGLAPNGETLAAEEMDRLGDDSDAENEDGKPDEETAGRYALLPSSMGMTFSVDEDVRSLSVMVRWGRYIRTKSEVLVDEKTGASPVVWKRIPFETVHDTYHLEKGRLKNWAPDPELPQVTVQGLVRRHDREWIITLFLVNDQPSPKLSKDAAWLFQTELEVRAQDGTAVFCRRPMNRPENQQATIAASEDGMMNMLYRDVAEFAVGHGIAVHADPSVTDPFHATLLRTCAVPRFEVAQTTGPTADDIPALADVELDMKVLSESDQTEIREKLEPLADAYAVWIQEQDQEARDPDTTLKPFADEAVTAIQRCGRTLRRIKEGIDLIAADAIAFEAFQFMNRAMWLQRIHTILAQQQRRGQEETVEEVDVPDNRTWYPFQLAFILLNLPGVTDVHHQERSDASGAVADLLWFPTGGGKTEAYLGVAAYTLALRRLQGIVGDRNGEYGLGVLMRYTLRLLTLQQFQRATTLICACESIRREALENGDPRWGENPFRIGLWVGSRVTPNTTQSSYEAVRQAHGETYQRRSGSPYQLVNCPWCGTDINPGRDLEVETFKAGRSRTIQYCGDRLGRCLFSRKQAPGEGLPVLVVDEEIYRNPPALLIATVDKFAQMPWKGEVQTLFGQVEGRCERHGFRSPDLEDTDRHQKTRNGQYPAAKTLDTPLLRPPDLIIQDELHLISGPLGTLVGLYETAVDRLSSWHVDGRLVRPKLIASTATIRNASEQVYALYRRNVQVFPPQGLSVKDNFFSLQRIPSGENPGRLYLGICATGRRMKAALIRTYASLMAAAQSLYEENGDIVDPWMTTVGYFNSIRELGGMRRLLDDDIASRLRRMDRRGLANRAIWPTSVEELTSRKSSIDIPKILDRLEVPFRVKQETRGVASPLDAVLATNMVSVGVDVRRLGMMVVCGQPKTTAEYIQATSRVGRGHPGLVVTVYNWARPRDLSHYERFRYYHETFYKSVEALSVTPFAPRALDRALFGLLVSLVRLGGLEFNANDRAAHIDPTHPLVEEAIDMIAERAHAVTHRAETKDEVRDYLKRLRDDWMAESARMSAGGYPLGYQKGSDTSGLLRVPGKERWDEFTCLHSLRNVESSVGLILEDGGLDDDSPFLAQESSEQSTEGDA